MVSALSKRCFFKRENISSGAGVKPVFYASQSDHTTPARDQSVSGGATCGRDSQPVTLDTCERDLGVGFTSTSLCSMENTSPGKPFTKATTTGDDHDSVCHSRPQAS